jgi:hypothetical protein
VDEVTEHAAPSTESDPIEAELTYALDTGVKPVTGQSVPGGELRYRTGAFETRRVLVRDARAIGAALSLDEHGFILVDHPTRATDFDDEAAVRAVYYPEIQALVRGLTGAREVLVFDHTLRSGDETEQAARRLREPVKIVHNDYTEWSGPQRLRDLLPAAEAQAWLRGRIAVVQAWRPIGHPVEASPLAICDARSVAAADLIASERRHPDRVGEIYQVAYSPAHRWYWFPRMRPDEALVFKCYDSLRDGRARFTAHTAFDDPGVSARARPRHSIEVRTLALFGDDAVPGEG